MKKYRGLFLLALLILVALSTAALATDDIEQDAFVLTNTTSHYDEDGELYYLAEDYVTLTATRDLWWVYMCYCDYPNGDIEAAAPSFIMTDDNIIIDTDAKICIESTGEIMSYYDWADAYFAGTTTFDDNPYFLAGSTFTVRGTYYFAFQAYDNASAHTNYFVYIADTDGIDSFPET